MKAIEPIKKYIALTSIVIINTFWVFPYMKKKYVNFFTNKAEVTHIVFLDISVDNLPKVRLDIGLFGNQSPKNINNLLHFIAKTGKKVRNNLSYDDTNFFKIVPKFIMQGGDIEKNDGTGHTSVYNNEYIEDEINKDLTFCEPGLVALANKGKNTNGSQFFITLDELPELDGNYTIVGRVLKGYDKLKTISSLCGSIEGNALCNVKITDTGLYNYDDYKKGTNKIEI